MEQKIEGPTHPVAELIAQGMTVMRVENESQQAMATMKPRDEAKVYAGAVKELELAPQFAKTAWYSIPYKDGEKTVFVEGPSITAAMALARRWGAWLARETGLPVYFFDERYTTVDAEDVLRSAGLKLKDRQAKRDMLAARLLLQNYLDAGCPETEQPPAPLMDQPGE